MADSGGSKSNFPRSGIRSLCSCRIVAAASTGSVATGPAVIDAVHMGHAVAHEQDGVDAVAKALRAGGDLNERDQVGWTSLMHAALECRPAIMSTCWTGVQTREFRLPRNERRRSWIMDRPRS